MTGRGCREGEVARRAFWLAGMLILVTCAPPELWPREKNARFLPELQSGQTIVYEIHGRVQRKVKAESRVSSILKPADDKQEFSGELRVKIKEVKSENGRPVVLAQAGFEYPVTAADAGAPAEKRSIEFTITGNGQIKGISGYDELEPIERMAWQFWISRFAFGWTLPAGELKSGAKWKEEEPENNPAPISRLFSGARDNVRG